MDFEKKECSLVEVDGLVSTGKQFDIDITLPEDNRSVIYGIIKDCYDEPIKDAVVKLIEVDRDYGKEERKPITHTFTDKNGEFVFGPLCSNKYYEIQVWANKVKHQKICTTCHHKGKCLKGIKLDCDCKEYFPKHDEDCKRDFDKDC